MWNVYGMIFNKYCFKEGFPSQGCVWNVYGMIFNNYCFKEGILSQGCVWNVYGMIFNNYLPKAQRMLLNNSETKLRGLFTNIHQCSCVIEWQT